MGSDPCSVVRWHGMTRPLRLEFPGAVWHVTSRGNEGREIFRDGQDRERFVSILGRTVSLFGWRLHAYVLMKNHHHLLVETPEPTLSRGMRQLNGLYTQAFNRRHRRVGHLLQGRFKGILVERESHLLELGRYVVLNPVRAGLVRRPNAWEWSSYRATAGLEPAPSWLRTDETLEPFGRRHGEAVRKYRAFIAEGKARDYKPWTQLEGQVYLGGDGFRKKLARRLRRRRAPRGVAKAQLHPARPAMEAVVREAERAFGELAKLGRQAWERKVVAYILRTESLATYPRIGEVLGVGEWMAGQLTRQGEQILAKDRALARRIRRIQV